MSSEPFRRPTQDYIDLRWLLVALLFLVADLEGISAARSEATEATPEGEYYPLEPKLPLHQGTMEFEYGSNGSEAKEVKRKDRQKRHEDEWKLCSTEDLKKALEGYAAIHGGEDLIKQVQRRLWEGGYYKDIMHEKIVDGKIGVDTKSALQRYCRERIGATYVEIIESLAMRPVEEHTERFGKVYRIDSEILERLERPKFILEKLENLKDIPFSGSEFLVEVSDVLEDTLADRGEDYDAFLREILKVSLDVHESQPGSAKDSGDETTARNKAQVTGSEIPEPQRYTLTTDKLDTLSRTVFLTLPDEVMEGLMRLEGREYLDASLFRAAVREALASHLLSKLMEGDTIEDCPESDEKNAQFGDLLDPDGSEQRASACANRLTAEYWEILSRFAEIEHSIDTVKPVAWSGCGSGCVVKREERGRGEQDVLYGFYPFWGVGKPSDRIAQGSTKAAEESEEKTEETTGLHEPAFEILSRIGYFAFELTDDGGIRGDNPGFNDLAHKHDSRVDMVLYKDEWSGWQSSEEQLSANQKEEFFETARENILAELETRSTSLFSRALPYLYWGFEKRPTIWDGVTLFFGDFPDRDFSYFHEFVTKLRNDIRDTGRDFYLNIMLSLDQIGKGVYRHENLGDLEDHIHLFIVLLEEPITETKKRLRREMEDNFEGVQRRDMLSKIVPVISPVGHDKDVRGPYVQFEDDLIYFQWNFAGVGFWPLLMRDQADYKEVQDRVIGVEQAQDVETTGASVEQYIGKACVFACPNRWWFQIGFNALTIFWLVLAVTALFCACDWARFFRRYRLVLVLLIAGTTVAIFLTSLSCDPFWRERQSTVLFAVPLLVLIVAGIVMIKRAKQGQQP